MDGAEGCQGPAQRAEFSLDSLSTGHTNHQDGEGVPRANSSGVMYPKLLCGRSPLYTSLYDSIFSLALAMVWNQLAFRHSSRRRPLKLSTRPFCIGRPG